MERVQPDPPRRGARVPRRGDDPPGAPSRLRNDDARGRDPRCGTLRTLRHSCPPGARNGSPGPARDSAAAPLGGRDRVLSSPWSRVRVRPVLHGSRCRPRGLRSRPARDGRGPAPRRGLRRARPVRVRVAACGLALVLTVAGLFELGAVVFDYRQRNGAFPAIAGFDGAWEERFVHGHDADLTAVEAPESWGLQGRVGELVLRDGPWPGLGIREPCPDWTGYQTLEFTIRSDRGGDAGTLGPGPQTSGTTARSSIASTGA